MAKFTQLTMPTLDDPTALQKINPELWLTQEVLDTAWVRLKDSPNEVVGSALKDGDDWVINTQWGNTHHTTYSSLSDLLMLHIDPDIVRVLKLKANNEVDLLKEFNPLWLWGLFSPLHWVFTIPDERPYRVTAVQYAEKGFSLFYNVGPYSNTCLSSVKNLKHLSNSLVLMIPENVLEIFSAKGQFPHLISNEFSE